MPYRCRYQVSEEREEKEDWKFVLNLFFGRGSGSLGGWQIVVLYLFFFSIESWYDWLDNLRKIESHLFHIYGPKTSFSYFGFLVFLSFAARALDLPACSVPVALRISYAA